MESINLNELIAGLEDKAREHKSVLVENMIGYSDITEYFRVLPGILDEQALLEFAESDKIMKPYKGIFEGTAKVTPRTRTLKVRTAKIEMEFEPAAYEKTFLSHNFHAKYKPETKQELGFADFSMYIFNVILQKARLQISEAVFNGVYNPEGNDAKDTINGLVAIIENDIAEGEISSAKGNLITMPELLSNDPVNVYEGLEKFFKMLPPRLWADDFYMFVPPEMLALYNEGFREINKTNVWYDNFNRQYLLAGNGKNVRLLGVAGLSGYNNVVLTKPSNLFFGFDTGGNFMFQRHDWKVRAYYRFNIGIQYGSSRYVWTNLV